jgi:hypothetical protein
MSGPTFYIQTIYCLFLAQAIITEAGKLLGILKLPQKRHIHGVPYLCSHQIDWLTSLSKPPPTRQPQESFERIVDNQVGSLTSLVYVYLYLCPCVWMSR